VASTVKGVRSVVNRIKVQPDKPRSDEEIRRDVTQELTPDPAADSYQLAAEIDDGVVALTDTVKS
jgi:osmotically-inducible protein OsmY